MKILCYARPWNVEQFKTIAAGLNENSEIKIISEHQGVDELGLEEGYYSLIKSKKKLSSDYVITSLDRDMIQRCRLLRSLKQEVALQHLNYMREAVFNVFESFHPNIVISITIDSFVIDCIYQEAQKRNIQFIGLIPSFINGYTRITSRGEYSDIRSVDAREVQEVSDKLLEKNYAPGFTKQSMQSPVKSTLKRWFMHFVRYSYFTIQRLKLRDRYNYHFWASQIVSWQLMHWFPRLQLGNNRWKTSIDKNKIKIYLPLQMIPEATVDYWCDQLSHTEYESTLIAFIHHFQNDCEFLIKEHPNVLGYRNSSIYKSLEELSNVTIVPTYENSNDVLDFSDAICVWTGSVGFEAVLRGKPVLSFCKPYYDYDKAIAPVTINSSYREVKDFIDNYSACDRNDFVKRSLSSLVKVNFINNGTWQPDNECDVRDASILGSKILSIVKHDL